MGFTVPRAPELEAPALEAGYNHVVLDLGDAAEVLLALGGPAADLVARSQSVFLYWNYTLIEHGFMLVQGARSTADPRKREQHLAAARQVVARVRAYVRDWQDDPRAAALGFRLAFLEGELEDAEGNPR